jgi:hypothetical protein
MLRAPAIETWPATLPLVSKATISGLPESLCDHSRPGLVRLTTSPLASDNPANRTSEPAGLHVAGSSGGASPEPDAVATIAAQVTTTQRFSIATLPAIDVNECG